jgi:hypothetical protein
VGERNNIKEGLSGGERDPCDLALLDHCVCPHKKMIPGPVFLFASTVGVWGDAHRMRVGAVIVRRRVDLTRKRAA